MSHKFDVNSRSKLDNPKRREFLPPEQILKDMGLKEGEFLADIGCGIGYFSLPAAKLVGSRGQIFALDIRREMLADVEQRIKDEGISNIETVLTEEYEFKLEDLAASKALICLVLHEINDKERFLKEAGRILKPDGSLAVIEWIKRGGDWGPPAGHRLDKEEVEGFLKEAGFSEIRTKELNEHVYLITAVKK